MEQPQPLGLDESFIPVRMSSSNTGDRDLPRVVGHGGGEAHPFGAGHRGEHLGESPPDMWRRIAPDHGATVVSTIDGSYLERAK